MNVQDVEVALRAAAIAGAMQLRTQLLNAAASGAIESRAKSDGSHVTAIDEDVERTMGQMIVRDLTHREGLGVVGEEGTLLGRYGDVMYVVFFDPVDGTALVRLLAPGSTTGACMYNTWRRQFLAAAVADPWLGRVVFTRDGETFQQRFDPASGMLLGEPVRCRVSDGSFEVGGELLIEVAHGFSRKEFPSGELRQVLTQYEIDRLWSMVHTKLGTKVRMLSSNLMHQMVVALGGNAVATIMTAIGGPWDMSGVALVLGAGGTVLFVRAGENGQFELVDDPMMADLVICANSIETAQQVFNLLLSIRY